MASHLCFLAAVEDRLPRRGGDRVGGLALDAGGLGLGGHGVEDLLRVLGRELRVFLARDRLVDDAVGVRGQRVVGRGVERGEPGADRLREVDRVRDRLVGELGAVGGDEQVLVHDPLLAGWDHSIVGLIVGGALTEIKAGPANGQVPEPTAIDPGGRDP